MPYLGDKHVNSNNHKSFTEDLGNGVTLDMVYIPGDTFLMGSPESEVGHRDNESPQHKVTVQPFFMGKFAVTQAQWEVVAGLPKVKIDLETELSHFKGAKHSVDKVSWDDAVEFCSRLSQKTGREYRLPSEAEWEYACHAGTTMPFHFGKTITTDWANYNGNYIYRTYITGFKGQFREQTTDVGSFPANAFGLYDMHGNVWEWCQDTMMLHSAVLRIASSILRAAGTATISVFVLSVASSGLLSVLFWSRSPTSSVLVQSIHDSEERSWGSWLLIVYLLNFPKNIFKSQIC